MVGGGGYFWTVVMEIGLVWNCYQFIHPLPTVPAAVTDPPLYLSSNYDRSLSATQTATRFKKAGSSFLLTLLPRPILLTRDPGPVNRSVPYVRHYLNRMVGMSKFQQHYLPTNPNPSSTGSGDTKLQDHTAVGA